MARAAFVLAAATCAVLGGWAAVAVLVLCRVGARWPARGVAA